MDAANPPPTSTRRPKRPTALQRRLLDKSIDAFVQSLDSINRPAGTYRIDAFSLLICNAWHLLLKPKILGDTRRRTTVFPKTAPNEPPHSISLHDSLALVFTDPSDPQRRNIERVAQLRDAAAHLLIDQVPREAVGLFQACVLGFHTRLVEWFGRSLTDRVSAGMMTLAYDYSPEDFDPSDPALRRRLGNDTADFLASFQSALRQEFAALGRSPQFSIDVTYRLALTKTVGEGDIVVEAGATGPAVRFIEVPKDPSQTHPYRQIDAAREIIRLLDGATTVSLYDVMCVVKVHNVARRPDLYYRGTFPHSVPQLSPAFVQWAVDQYRRDPTFFADARQKVKDAAPAPPRPPLR